MSYFCACVNICCLLHLFVSTWASLCVKTAQQGDPVQLLSVYTSQPAFKTSLSDYSHLFEKKQNVLWSSQTRPERPATYPSLWLHTGSDWVNWSIVICRDFNPCASQTLTGLKDNQFHWRLNLCSIAVIWPELLIALLVECHVSVSVPILQRNSV